MTETQLTLLNYAYILRRNKHHLPLSLCSSSFIKYSCVFTFTKWTNTSWLKALANGFNICFNILSILLNGNVESVCHPLSTLLKRVERMLNRCWKSLKAFKLCFNIHSTFLLFSKMFGMLKRSWNHLPRSFNIVDQAHAQLRRRNHGHHGWKDGNKARQFCEWLIVRANLSFGETTLFPPRTCYE